jgi:hypothetical protein
MANVNGSIKLPGTPRVCLVFITAYLSATVTKTTTTISLTYILHLIIATVLYLRTAITSIGVKAVN